LKSAGSASIIEILDEAFFLWIEAEWSQWSWLKPQDNFCLMMVDDVITDKPSL
jgi:hypothetical protein